MLILESLITCSDASLATIVMITKRVLNIVQILGPILAIISLIITCINLVINPDNKKLFSKIKNSIISLAILFFIPMLVNVVMEMCDDRFDFTTCWNYEEQVQVFGNDVTYVDVDGGNKQSVISNPGEYENGGNKKPTDSSNNTTPGVSNGGAATSIRIQYNVKDSKGRCGNGKSDTCIQVATVKYPTKTVKYYMGRQDNSGLLGGSCRSHAFTCGVNATKGTNYSTLDLQNYLYSTGDNGVLKGASRFSKAINHFGVNAKAYFNETSISQSISLAEKALNNGQPVIIFVANSKCSDLASSHHALLLLGYDSNGDVVFIDSCGRYKNAKKRNLKELGQCMSGDSIAKNWMRMVIFSF